MGYDYWQRLLGDGMYEFIETNKKEKENKNMDRIKFTYKDAKILECATLTPPMCFWGVKDVSVYNDRVVTMMFDNGEVYKAICDEADKFDIERGMEVCLLKYFLNGSKNYNNFIRDLKKQYHNKLEEQKKEEENKKHIQHKREKKQAAKRRREERKREEQINIQKEAYIRAMKEMQKAEGDCDKDTK